MSLARLGATLQNNICNGTCEHTTINDQETHVGEDNGYADNAMYDAMLATGYHKPLVKNNEIEKLVRRSTNERSSTWWRCGD